MKSTIIAKITNTPKVNINKNGTKMVSARARYMRRFTNPSTGEYEVQEQYITIIAYKEAAEVLEAARWQDGQAWSMTGEVEYRKWEDKKGHKHHGIFLVLVSGTAKGNTELAGIRFVGNKAVKEHFTDGLQTRVRFTMVGESITNGFVTTRRALYWAHYNKRGENGEWEEVFEKRFITLEANSPSTKKILLETPKGKRIFAHARVFMSEWKSGGEIKSTLKARLLKAERI